MKHMLLLSAILTFTIGARAVDLLPGYIVMANNDTIQCKIKGGRFLSTPSRGITIVNEEGESESLPSKEKKIIAFGFIENFRKYNYKFIDVGDKLESGFYQLLNAGRYKLYGKPATVYGGNPMYVLYNLGGEFLKFEPCVICPWKKQLRVLLKDDAKALAAVEDASRVNIPKFVAEINQE